MIVCDYCSAIAAVLASSLWALAVCKYGGGRLGYVWWHQTEGRHAESPTVMIPITSHFSLALWTRKGIDAALLVLWPPALRPVVKEMVLRFFIGHQPYCVYCQSTWHHMQPDLPGLPPPYLHTASDQRLEVGQPGNEDSTDIGNTHLTQ